MSELKLTVEQLKNYLGTGLEVKNTVGNTWDHKIETFKASNLIHFERQVPICYRLSDLDKFIPELGFVPFERLPYGNKPNFYKPINPQFDLEITIQTEDYSQEVDLYDGFKIMSLLFQWNFWPFGDEYFEEGLIIDKLNLQTK